MKNRLQILFVHNIDEEESIQEKQSDGVFRLAWSDEQN